MEGRSLSIQRRIKMNRNLICWKCDQQIPKDDIKDYDCKKYCLHCLGEIESDK